MWLALALAAFLVVGFVGAVLLIQARLGGPDAEELHAPPSERQGGASARSADRSTEGVDQTARSTVVPDGTSGSGYEELRCVFSGTALLSPGLPYSYFSSSAQTMRLQDGASFECDGPPAETSGDVSMNATFDSLGLFSGVGRGGGVIEWSDTGPSGTATSVPLGEISRSTTWNEVELIYPQIIVWVTIDDGLWAGFEGKLVLEDWERVHDSRGHIIEIVFEPTKVVFSPV